MAKPDYWLACNNRKIGDYFELRQRDNLIDTWAYLITDTKQKPIQIISDSKTNDYYFYDDDLEDINDYYFYDDTNDSITISKSGYCNYFRNKNIVVDNNIIVLTPKFGNQKSIEIWLMMMKLCLFGRYLNEHSILNILIPMPIHAEI